VSERFKVGLALLATYTIWGSTYLGMNYALESFPPLHLAALRFLAASVIMMLFMRWRGASFPTAREFLGGMGVGMILLGLGNGGVVLGLHYHIPTGLTALILASSPIWAAVFAGFWGLWPNRREVIGLLVGFCGVIVLRFDGQIQAAPIGFLFLMLAAMGWSMGTVLIPRVKQSPNAYMASGAQMLGASVTLFAAALVTGEQMTTTLSTTSLWAFGYLLIFGSLIGFTAYSYLVPRVRPALAISSAYVNPMVAVLLGTLLNRESISSYMLYALPLIIGGVLLMSFAKAKKLPLQEATA
jgi:drug/metabolite transporter (DMT)-like permease